MMRRGVGWRRCSIGFEDRHGSDRWRQENYFKYAGNTSSSTHSTATPIPPTTRPVGWYPTLAALGVELTNTHTRRGRSSIGHLAQRCHGLLSKGQTLALFVDESPKQDDIRAHVREFKKNGTWSKIDRRPLKNILDTVYFAPSCESRLLQAADLVSYAHFRARMTPVTSKSHGAGKQAWGIVENLCDCNFWVP